MPCHPPGPPPQPAALVGRIPDGGAPAGVWGDGLTEGRRWQRPCQRRQKGGTAEPPMTTLMLALWCFS